jgi:hypothetical protein
MAEQPDLPDPSSRHARLAVHYDVAKWIYCPRVFPPGHDVDSWSSFFAEAFSSRPLAAQLRAIHTYTYSNVACHVCFIHQPSPQFTPLPVYMACWQARGSRDEALRQLTNLGDPDSIQQPYADEIKARYLGTGLRVLRYGAIPDDQEKIFAALNYAWRVPELETDVRVFAATSGLGRLQAAMTDIDELVNVTRLVPKSAATPVGEP